jgi:hypothetical protein
MTKPSYTMTIENEAGIEETVARGVALEDALRIAIEHDGAGEAVLVVRDVGEGRLVSIGRRLSEDGAFECLAFVFTPRLRLPGPDEDHARRSFEQKLLANTGKFWGGRVETDDDHARRQAAGRA